MKNLKKIVTLLLVIVMMFAFVACNNTSEKEKPQNDNTTVQNVDDGIKKEGLWTTATYVKDTSFGEGAKTLKIKVEADDRSVIFTIKTDKETVGAALLEHSLIAGDESEYGLYIKVVNGIKADYDTDKAYWSFNKNGEYMMTGVDSTEFTDGEQYELVYTKG